MLKRLLKEATVIGGCNHAGVYVEVKSLKDRINDRNILFIATKNKDYIRNSQEIKLLKKHASFYDESAFYDKSYLKRVFKVYLACCRGKWKQADVIFVGFAPQLILPFIKRWYKKKEVIIDFFISLYDTFVHDRKKIKDNSICAKLLHRIDEMTLQYCHHIIVDTLEDKKYFSEEFNIPSEKMEVLYLEADTDIYDIKKYNIIRNEKVMSVLYFGSILPLQGVDIILDAAKLLKEQADIKFTIIGPVMGKNHHKELCNKNIEFYDWVTPEKLAEKIAAADVCLAGHFNAQIEKAKRTIPGKAYIYEAMGKIIILGENRANRELFLEDDKHFYVEMGNARVLADKILDLRNRGE